MREDRLQEYLHRKVAIRIRNSGDRPALNYIHATLFKNEKYRAQGIKSVYYVSTGESWETVLETDLPIVDVSYFFFSEVRCMKELSDKLAPAITDFINKEVDKLSLTTEERKLLVYELLKKL